MVISPIAIMGWLSARLARQEEALRERRIEEATLEAMRSIDESIHTVLEESRGAIGARVLSAALDPQSLRDLEAKLPQVRQLFVLDPSGELLYPSLLDAATRQEASFLERTRSLWIDRHRLAEQSGAAREAFPDVLGREDQGFYALYADGGLCLLAFWKKPDGHILGAEVDRMYLLARVVGALPGTKSGLSDRMRLVDASGATLHQWGSYEPPDGARASLRLPLSAPLSSLALERVGAPLPPARFSLLSGSLPWIVLAAIALVLVATYFYRESSREMREAAQRVSFVNQVSHELKTPLTNVRMYAELLEGEVDEGSSAHRYSSVIVSESQRLSRLISNILAFHRNERKELTCRPSVGVVDETIRSILKSFAPALAAAGIEARFEGSAEKPCLVDRDALGQILGNLLNNVEKYAAGKAADVESHQERDRVTITVRDEGPGIPEPERRRIFEPFYRISNALADGVTGTGMGLAIARELARLHGGDLDVVPSERGACFRLTILAPEATS